MVCMTNTFPPLTDAFVDVEEELVSLQPECDNFNQAFLTAGFELLLFKTGLAGQLGTMVLVLGDPAGEIVHDAQVITTIIGQSGAQEMRRARPRNGGYLIDTMHLTFGQYRLEVEIVTDGWLLTNEFYFQKVYDGSLCARTDLSIKDQVLTGCP